MHGFVFNGPKSYTSPELYGSESIRQVCATIVDFLGDIPEETRNRIVGWLYDDMCHLKPYSEKQENQLGAMGQLFAGMKKAVDTSGNKIPSLTTLTYTSFMLKGTQGWILPEKL